MISLISIHVITSIWWMRFVWHRSILYCYCRRCAKNVLDLNAVSISFLPRSVTRCVCASVSSCDVCVNCVFAFRAFMEKTFCCQQRANINKTIPYPNDCITCTALDSSIFFLTLSFRFSIFFPTRCRNLCAFVSWFLLKHKRCLISSTLFRRTFTWCLWIELCLLTNISTPVTVLFHSFPALHMTSTIYECSVDFIFQCSGWRNRHF